MICSIISIQAVYLLDRQKEIKAFLLPALHKAARKGYQEFCIDELGCGSWVMHPAFTYHLAIAYEASVAVWEIDGDVGGLELKQNAASVCSLGLEPPKYFPVLQWLLEQADYLILIDDGSDAIANIWEIATIQRGLSGEVYSVKMREAMRF